MPDGLITVRSAFDPAETKARLLAVLKDKGVTVFADIPHAKGAAQAGLVLAYSDLVIFGKPDAGTPLMQAAPTAGIDLPMKALVWQDADGVAWLSYNDSHWIAARHGIGWGARGRDARDRVGGVREARDPGVMRFVRTTDRATQTVEELSGPDGGPRWTAVTEDPRCKADLRV